jgi:hypothetical protein
MKTIIKLSIILVAMTLTSCNTTTGIKHETDLLILVDLTQGSTNMFHEIQSDIRQNFTVFMHYLGLGSEVEINGQRVVLLSLEPHQRFRMQVSPIWTGPFNPTSITAEIDHVMSMRSLQQARSGGNHMVLSLFNRLDYFKSVLAENQSQSSVIETILRGIAQLGSDDENLQSRRTIMLICSDLMEFSPTANFYNRIPTPQETWTIMNRIDPFILDAAKRRVATIGAPEVIINLQVSRPHRTTPLRIWWSTFFEELGITNVSFIDNLAQRPV